MRVFGILGLLLALAMVAVLASRQSKTLVAQAGPASAASATAQEQARTLQRKVADDVNSALQKSLERNAAGQEAASDAAQK
jgi:hypothetical protein